MGPRANSDIIRKFIIDHVEEHPRDVTRLVKEHFGITRQAVNRHMKTLIEDGIIEAEGQTKERSYSLKVTYAAQRLLLAENREEDVVWREHVLPGLGWIPENIANICYYGFTEIFNNAIDHSEGEMALIWLGTTSKTVTLGIADDGIGIFEKIRSRFNLEDHRQAVLELSKGKLTTDPARHTGQGIFFASRMFDAFSIRADHLYFSHDASGDGWLVEVNPTTEPGTSVIMEISTDSKRTSKEVFDLYTDLDSDDYAFSKTHVPLALAKYGEEQLISRSQAKRVLARFDRFKEVFLDFAGVDSIGQAFADEIFRVFHQSNPEIKVIAINGNEQVMQMIKRATSDYNTPSAP